MSNNWGQTADMYSELYGNRWPRFYFSIFYVVMIMVILNIVVSFVIEIYSSTLDEEHKDSQKIGYAKRLMIATPTEEQLKELMIKAALYD